MTNTEPSCDRTSLVHKALLFESIRVTMVNVESIHYTSRLFCKLKEQKLTFFRLTSFIKLQGVPCGLRQ